MDNDDRIAYFAGDREAPLGPSDQAELDQVRQVLSDPAVWVEPPTDLQERIVGAIIEAQDGGARRRPRWIPYPILGVAAAAVLAVGLAIGFTRGDGARSVQYAAALRGTTLSPDAAGQVTLTQTASGWKIQLHASGLPRRDQGRCYEAWLKNRAGVLVAVGTFNQADDVTLWAGVPPSDYPTLTVTRQLANGDQSSSGQVVLSGPTHRRS